MFLPACSCPVKNSTTLYCSSTATSPEVLIASAAGLTPPASARLRSAISSSTRMGVSSLCSSGAWAAWRISSWNTARGAGEALETISHWVASGSGMYSEACSPWSR